MITVWCRFDRLNKEGYGKTFLRNHLGSIQPKDKLNMFNLSFDEIRMLEILQDALRNKNATIEIKFDDLVMEIR